MAAVAGTNVPLSGWMAPPTLRLAMLPARLIEFIDTYADTLTRHAVRDLSTSWRTRSFDLVPASELEARVFATYCRVASWIAEPSDDTVREDYERWGAARFRQGIPLSEIVYALFLLKHNLRRSLRDHEVLAAADDRASAQ